jgi:hypothetical protein
MLQLSLMYLRPSGTVRRYSQQITAAVGTRGAPTATSPPVVRSSNVPAAQQSTKVIRHPYFLPRNSLGSLPVYTDVRNAGSRYMVLIRNVEGNVNVSAVLIF